MKKIILLLAGAALICGCNKSNTDSAKIEALSQKLDYVMQNQGITISNQVIIWNEVEAVKSEITNLPTWDAMNENSHFYYTNMVGLVSLQAQNIQNTIFEESGNVKSSQSATQDSLREIDSSTWQTLFILTNGVTHDVGLTQLTVHDMEYDIALMKSDQEAMQDDVTKIKTRLGILY
jgi:hypothetical protein